MKKIILLLTCLSLGLLANLKACAQTRICSITQHIKKQKNNTPILINSFPYYESFETNIGWHQVTGDDGDWTRHKDGTPSQNTGPSNGAEGYYYIFLEASTTKSIGKMGTKATAIIESAPFDLSAQTEAIFSFSNHMYGENLGSLILQASTNNGEWTSLWSFAGNNGNQWNKVDISLHDYLGENSVKLRFVGITGEGWSSDIGIDALSITTKGDNNNTNSKTTPNENTEVKRIHKTISSATSKWSALADNVKPSNIIKASIIKTNTYSENSVEYIYNE